MKRNISFTLLFAVGAVFLSPAMASANNGPSGSLMLAEMLMFVVLIALTAAGGGYAVMNKIKPRGRWTGAGYMLLAFAGFFLSVSVWSTMPLVFLVVAVWGIQRGVKMVVWGGRARSGKQRPDHLVEANPWRLIIAGAFLVLLMVAIPAVGYEAFLMEGRPRLLATVLNYNAKNAYTSLKEYETTNPKATGTVTCDDLQKTGFALSSRHFSCSSDVMIKSGKVVSGSIRITWTMEPGFMTPHMSKPEAVITCTGELSKAKP